MVNLPLIFIATFNILMILLIIIIAIRILRGPSISSYSGPVGNQLVGTYSPPAPTRPYGYSIISPSTYTGPKPSNIY
ncbi:unnamed protein product [marine sediment metagenome]|uniref:Uncharacterized protein n=1 Tax=marine sediment metagenome TaxID=412755 RepID=X1JQD3_9ZZZZ